MKDINADADMLVLQTADTTAKYLKLAIRHIDEAFGNGYAAKNPTLVAEFMRTCATDFQTAAMKVCAQDLRDAITSLSMCE
jgi:hypothetical protein